MATELYDLLSSVESGVKANESSYTHITYLPSISYWNIDGSQLGTFWAGYCDLVKRKEETLCLAERIPEIAPVVADLIFRFRNEVNEPFTNELVMFLVYVYQKILREDFEVTNENLYCCVLESEMWENGTEEIESRGCSTRLRLQFPYCRISMALQAGIRKKVITALHGSSVMQHFREGQPEGTWDSIIAPLRASLPLPLYGSVEKEEESPLYPTVIYGIISEEIALGDEGQPDYYDPESFFKPAHHQHVLDSCVSSNLFIQNSSIEYWYPFFYSMFYWFKVTNPKRKEEQIKRSEESATKTSNPELALALSFLPLISRTRFQDPIERRTIGACLKECDRRGNTKLGFKIWSDYVLRYLGSKGKEEMGSQSSSPREGEGSSRSSSPKSEGLSRSKSSKFEELSSSSLKSESGEFISSGSSSEEINLIGVEEAPPGESRLDNEPVNLETLKRAYSNFNNKYNLSVKTLAWYAREDSPKKYDTWHAEYCRDIMMKSLKLSHDDVAATLYRVYWLDFICAIDRSTTTWYFFLNGRWKISGKGIDLEKKINPEFISRYEALRRQMCDDVQKSTDESVKRKYEEQIKAIGALIAKLKDVPYVSNIMKAVIKHFELTDVVAKFDSNYDLFAVDNGVFEMMKDRVIFRKGRPEDYITKFTAVPFKPHYHLKHKKLQPLLIWLGQAFPDEELCHFFKKFAASCLKGMNSDKLFSIFTGDTNNSKSMIVKLFETTFGSYFIKFDISVLSKKKTSSSNATPELARAKHTRIVVIDEPDKKDKINAAEAKRYTGNDSFTARALFENSSDFQMSFKLIIQCNGVPEIENADPAVEGRVLLFPFLSTWVKDAPKEEEERMKQRLFQRDPFFDEKVKEMAPAFLWLLFHYYPIYMREGLATRPKVAIDATKKYWAENDIYALFSTDTVKEIFLPGTNERDKGARLTLNIVYTEFKSWYRSAFGNKDIPDRKRVRDELTRRWGPLSGNSWHGLGLKEEKSSSALGNFNGMNKV